MKLLSVEMACLFGVQNHIQAVCSGHSKPHMRFHTMSRTVGQLCSKKTIQEASCETSYKALNGISPMELKYVIVVRLKKDPKYRKKRKPKC